MRRNRRDSLKKERIIMVTSSAFVLAALTMTGLYMRGQEAKHQDDGYTLDFTALENSADRKLQETRDREKVVVEPEISLPGGTNMENDLDYMPAEEVDSKLIEIPGLTDGISEQELDVPGETVLPEPVVRQPEVTVQTKPEILAEELLEEQDELLQEERELHFSESDRLIRPVSGEAVLPYSMDGSIYFETLAQYKYNPATMYKAEEGAVVAVCAEGRVVNIYNDAEIGHAVAIDLGDGYLATYGQLSNVQVKVDDYVDAGVMLGTVAAPTKYYSLEGANLYFKLEKNGVPINPEVLF